MRWYNVNKYKPVINSKVFVRTQDGDISTANYRYDFENVNIVFMSDMDCIILHSATHFCIPDPIKVEE